MKHFYTILFSLSAFTGTAMAQSAMDAYMMSQSQLRGTARFMSMGGAFGALGADLSCLSQNPGGIGVYRSSDVGFTLDLDMMNSKTTSGGFSNSESYNKFFLNNIGGVFTWRLPSEACPNLNIGFTYNKVASFTRKYKGRIPHLNTSLSNYIAGIANSWDINVADLTTTGSYDPYNPPAGMRQVPWITILGYDAYLIDPDGNADAPHWYGQYGEGTSGTGGFDVQESGSIDEYNIALGGNIKNIVFWGLDFGITSIDYKIGSVWGESLDNAYVSTDSKTIERTTSDWALTNNYRLNGNGLNFKLGVIVKPIQELRIGLAFHTPTYYNLTETFYNESIDFKYGVPTLYNYVTTDGGYPGYNNVDFQTPWKVIASVAGVIGSRLIISADYEWNGYRTMKYTQADPGGWYDPWYDWDNPWSDWGGWYGAPAATRSYADDAIGYTNHTIKEVYRSSNTIRLGAEFRVLSNFSVRAGYSYTSSPVTSKMKDNLVDVPTAGTMANFRLDEATNYITCGVGYKYKGFYADLAYVYRTQNSEFYPFSPDPENEMSVTNSKVKFDASQLALTLGFKF